MKGKPGGQWGDAANAHYFANYVPISMLLLLHFIRQRAHHPSRGRSERGRPERYIPVKTSFFFAFLHSLVVLPLEVSIRFIRVYSRCVRKTRLQPGVIWKLFDKPVKVGAAGGGEGFQNGGIFCVSKTVRKLSSYINNRSECFRFGDSPRQLRG